MHVLSSKKKDYFQTLIPSVNNKNILVEQLQLVVRKDLLRVGHHETGTVFKAAN